MANCNATSESLLDSGTIVARKEKRRWWQILAFVTVWWANSIVVIVITKHTVKLGGMFPYAFTFTSMTQLGAGAAAWLFSVPVNWQQRRPVVALRWAELGMLLPVGLIQGVEIALTNKSLEYLSISTRTMITSTNVLFLMTAAWFWRLERLGTLKVTSAILLVAGGSLQGFDTADSHVTSRFAGILMQVGSIAIASQRMCLLQFIMQRSPRDSALSQMSKLSMLARIMPLTGVCCIVLGAAFEQAAFSAANLHFALVRNICAIAGALAIMLWMEFLLLNRLSAVALSVLCTLHQIPIALSGVIFDHNEVGVWQLSGFCTCMIGGIIYAIARNAESSNDAA
eukprot:TRINITY_DN67655_c0_g1_i1.p1 TRINITY_DN67655_c0_g1~~TRINITY_DN67655_c0_g1_i1.p1  ORF type:complete len:340 (-),score=28.12 TRINITY_DN67655_c0_g1_i1:15-1034(-)